MTLKCSPVHAICCTIKDIWSLLSIHFRLNPFSLLPDVWYDAMSHPPELAFFKKRSHVHKVKAGRCGIPRTESACSPSSLTPGSKSKLSLNKREIKWNQYIEDTQGAFRIHSGRMIWKSLCFIREQVLYYLEKIQRNSSFWYEDTEPEYCTHACMVTNPRTIVALQALSWLVTGRQLVGTSEIEAAADKDRAKTGEVGTRPPLALFHSTFFLSTLRVPSSISY